MDPKTNLTVEIYCDVLKGYEKFYFYFSFINTIVSFLLPLTLIFFQNISIIWIISKKRLNWRKKRDPTNVKFIQPINLPLLESKIEFEVAEMNFLLKNEENLEKKSEFFRFRRERSSNIQLLLISFCYLFLNLPQYAVRFKIELIGYNENDSDGGFEFREIGLFLSFLAFQLQFVINCLPYLIFRTNYDFFSNF